MRRRCFRVFTPGVLAVTLVLGAVGHAQGARPAATPGPADPELLEFLGASDVSADAAHPDDGAWMDYLARADLNRAARTPGPPVRAASATPVGSPPQSNNTAQGAQQ